MFDFRAFGKKRSADPLSDAKSAAQWAGDLPMGDIYAALDQATEALYAAGRHHALGAPRLAAIGVLDAAMQDALQTLAHQYLLNPRMAVTLENRLWQSVDRFADACSQAYHRYIMAYIENASAAPFKTSLPLITARWLHYFSLRAKWRFFRYEQVEPEAWKRAHDVYRFAEYEEMCVVPVALYPDVADTKTCCEAQYLRALMLDALHTGSLAPKQIEAADSVIARNIGLIPLTAEYEDRRHVFLVDLQAPRGAQRIRRLQPDKSLRFFGTRRFWLRCEEIRIALRNGVSPLAFGFTDACRAPMCMDLFARAEPAWAPSVARVRRQHTRERVMKRIEVVRRWEDIWNEIAQHNGQAEPAVPMNYDAMVDVRLYGFVTDRTTAKHQPAHPTLARHERWVVENESQGGLGALITDPEDWIRLGKIVGLRFDPKGAWALGAICRMSRMPSGEYYVGIRILARTPIVVRVRSLKQQPEPAIQRDRINRALNTAILIPRAGETSPATLVLPSAAFARNERSELFARDKSFMITLGDVHDKGEDWLRVGFKVEGAAQTSEESRPHATRMNK